MSFTAISRALSESDASAIELDLKIRHRAYELYLRRGDGPGDATQDWLQAEAELNASATRVASAAAKSRPRSKAATKKKP